MGEIVKRKPTLPGRRRSNPRRELTFLEHLDELRGRLIICVVSILLTTILGGIFFARGTLGMLTRPFQQSKDKVVEEPTDTVLRIRVGQNGQWTALNPEVLSISQTTSETVAAAGAPQAAGTTGTTVGALSRFWHKDRKKPVRKVDGIKIIAQDGSEWYFSGAGQRPGIISTSIFGPFMTLITMAIILGVVFAMPIWLYQIWLFVAPAFTTSERRVVRPVVLAGVFLFPMGVAFAYGMFYFIMPFALNYAEKFIGVQLLPDLSKYIQFALSLMLAMGIVFETPLALLLLVRMGVVSTQLLKRSRSYVVVIICIVAAVLTPPDPISMIVMALPMWLLFEISLIVATRVERKIEAAERKAAQAT